MPVKPAQKTQKPAKKSKSALEKQAERCRAYYESNREGQLELAKARYHAMTPAERALRRWKAMARPPRPRQGSKNSQDARKVALSRACCDWSDTEEVIRIYTACAVLNELGWGTYEVDHLVPLNHPLVCGLHTHTNLVVVHAHHNSAKGNMVWPDMPEITWETIELLLSRP